MPTVQCPNCCAKFDAQAEYRDRTVKCAECGKSFVLRFTRRSIPIVAVKVASRQAEREAEELKSTVSFRLPNPAGEATVAESKARTPERTDSATSKLPPEELKSTVSFRLPNPSGEVTEAESTSGKPNKPGNRERQMPQ